MDGIKIKFKGHELKYFSGQLINNYTNLKVKIYTDPKEINIFRLDYLEKLYKRILSKALFMEDSKKITITFSIIEMLIIRYCILNSAMNKDPFHTKILMDIDSKINPKMFSRK